jgi:hypothetical protein
LDAKKQLTRSIEVTRMALRPKAPIDIALAPVAAGVDLNLQRLRDKPPSAVDTELQLELDRPPIPNTRHERAAHVLRAALRNVEMHGWEGEITDDGCRLHLTGGSVTLDLGLSAGVTSYIDAGAQR